MQNLPRPAQQPVMVAYPPLRYFKLTADAVSPKFGTEQASCFDLAACLTTSLNEGLITCYDCYNRVQHQKILTGTVTIECAQRMLIPTGLVFDIPFGYRISLHARSGLALNHGIILANGEGIIDSDYVKQTFVMITNVSNVAYTIKHGDRIAQAEMLVDLGYTLLETPDLPEVRSDRIGGFGSTGTSV